MVCAADSFSIRLIKITLFQALCLFPAVKPTLAELDKLYTEFASGVRLPLCSSGPSSTRPSLTTSERPNSFLYIIVLLTFYPNDKNSRMYDHAKKWWKLHGFQMQIQFESKSLAFNLPAELFGKNVPRMDLANGHHKCNMNTICF